MAEKKVINSKKKKSVKDFQNEIRAEENKMQAYGKKFDGTVKSLKNEIRAKEQEMQKYGENFNMTVKGLENDWKKHGKQLNEAAVEMRNQGINKMKGKVREFNNEISAHKNKFNAGVKKLNNEILNQKKENHTAISRMKGDVGLFVSAIDGKRKDFESYAKGPFAGYIKAFWG
ncbi:MAG: hypothetical protein Q8N63_08490 [Nanoarchaeota archaeon]|nr:hypothetical protein [Nanoarchaeota archaeon]